MSKEHLHLLKSAVEPEQYVLHYRQSHFPFLFVSLAFGSGGYGDFDYVVLQQGDKSVGYLTAKGLKQAESLGNVLLDEKCIGQILDRQRKLLSDLESYESKEDDSSLERVRSHWMDIRGFCIRIGELYRYCEQPVMESLERKIREACKSDDDLLKVLDDISYAKELSFSDLQERYVQSAHALGEMKFRLHLSMERIFRSMYVLAGETGKIFGYEPEEILLMTREEMDMLFSGGSPERARVKRRIPGLVFFPRSGAILVGASYYEWKRKLEPAGGDVLHGMVAYKGMARGRVKVHLSMIESADIPKGSVLVAGMTNPQLVPYLGSVAAIVTDEGGITCHAAIVARELKKPCVIGTKIATQVLRDGDLVEVDADRGIITVLNRYE